MERKALRPAGDPAPVLDLPCGTGRLWPLLLERGERKDRLRLLPGWSIWSPCVRKKR